MPQICIQKSGASSIWWTKFLRYLSVCCLSFEHWQTVAGCPHKSFHSDMCFSYDYVPSDLKTLTILTCICEKLVSGEVFSHSSAEGGDVCVFLLKCETQMYLRQAKFVTAQIKMPIADKVTETLQLRADLLVHKVRVCISKTTKAVSASAIYKVKG